MIPITAVTEEYKVTKVRAVMTLRSSQDPKIRDAGLEERTGRKWKAKDAVNSFVIRYLLCKAFVL